MESQGSANTTARHSHSVGIKAGVILDILEYILYNGVFTR